MSRDLKTKKCAPCNGEVITQT